MKLPSSKEPIDPSLLLGYLRGFAEEFTLGKKLGKGGSGTVYAVTRLSDGAEFAVKIIPKILNDPTASERKCAAQLPSIRQEVEVLLALRGSLNVALLEDVYEDAHNVYMVIELCHGGELLGGSGNKRHFAYSERAIASFLRSILKTIAQCHARFIIHRDIKPENFLILSKEESAPIKAIDFGLAVFFSPDDLPITAPNVEGTPWYLAPESCRGKWWPATDVWAAGVMAAYMLTGVYPFIDRANPDMPDLARTLRVICFEELDQTGPVWKGTSEEAKEFVAYLLVKDPLKRPSAIDALSHPFLKEDEKSKKVDRPLHHSVVQRLQRFSQNGVFKRRVLEHIANDLVKMHFSKDKERSAHGGAVFKDRSYRGARAYEASVHGGRDPSTSQRMRRLPSYSQFDVNNSDPSRRDDSSMHSSQNYWAANNKEDSSVHSKQSYWPGSKEGSTRGGGSRRGRPPINKMVPAGVYLPVATPYSRRLAVLLDTLDVDKDGKVKRADMQDALMKMGYKLDDREAGELFDAVDVERKGEVAKAELSASLLDWKWVQDTYADRWVESVKRVFEGLDTDGDGELSASEIAAAFSGHLCPYEVDAAVHEALVEAAGPNAGKDKSTPKISFDHLLKLLQSRGPADDLGLYDDRLSVHSSRHASGNLDDIIGRNGKKGFLCCFSS